MGRMILGTYVVQNSLSPSSFSFLSLCLSFLSILLTCFPVNVPLLPGADLLVVALPALVGPVVAVVVRLGRLAEVALKLIRTLIKELLTVIFCYVHMLWTDLDRP